MSDYCITACSTADLSEERFQSLDIQYVCYHVTMDGVEYADDLGKSIPFDEFYRRISEGSEPRTSQVNADQYMALWRPILMEGRDVLHATLSSGITSSYNSAVIAAETLAEEFPDRKVVVVDSLCASSGYGLYMAKLAEKRDEGCTLEELTEYALKERQSISHWFFSTDLTSYLRGGRISRTSYTMGTLLNICPLLNVDEVGKLIPREKIRTKKKVIKAIAEKMFEKAEGGENYTGRCFMSYSACYEDARAVADLVEAHFPNMTGKVELYSIGTVIGAHTGPGTVALFFESKDRSI